MEAKVIIHKFRPSNYLDDWIVLKWRRRSFAVLVLMQFDLLYDVRLYIMRFLIF